MSAGTTIMGVTEVALSEDETFCKQGPATDLGSWYSFVGESDSRFSVSACSEFTDFHIQLSVFAAIVTVLNVLGSTTELVVGR
jgi:hypothetical protein